MLLSTAKATLIVFNAFLHVKLAARIIPRTEGVYFKAVLNNIAVL